SSQDTLPQVEITALKNDRDPNLDALEIVEIGTPLHGSAVLNEETQTITYTASAAEVQNDRFPYTISDGNGGTATAWVFIRTDLAGTYQGDLSSPPDTITGEPGVSLGSLSIRLNSKGTLS